MSRIFISYSSKTRNQVIALAGDLEMLGHQVWFDRELQGGQKWWDAILSAIAHCDHFIFALTNHALKSRPCELEYTYAYELRKPILPILMDAEVKIQLLPRVLQERQFVDYTRADKTALLALNSAIGGMPPAPDLPPTMPPPPPLPISPLGDLSRQISQQTLSYEEQLSIFHQLKGYYDDDDMQDDVVDLLQQLSNHPSMLAAVYRDIEDLLSRRAQMRRPSPNTPASRNSATDDSQEGGFDIGAFLNRMTAKNREELLGEHIEPASPDVGVVTIRRGWNYAGMLVGLRLDMDGQKIATLRNNSVLHFNAIPAGSHTLLVRGTGIRNVEHSFSIRPREHLYFTVLMRPGLMGNTVSITLMDRDTYIETAATTDEQS